MVVPIPSALTTVKVCGFLRYSCSNSLQRFGSAGLHGRLSHFPDDVSRAIGSTVKVPRGLNWLGPIPPLNMYLSRETAASVTAASREWGGPASCSSLAAEASRNGNRMAAKTKQRFIWLDLTPSYQTHREPVVRYPRLSAMTEFVNRRRRIWPIKHGLYTLCRQKLDTGHAPAYS